MPPRRTVKKDDESKHVRDPFVYGVGDQQIELPSLSWLKPGVVRKLRHLTEIDQMYSLFEMVLPEKQLEILDDLDPDEFEEMCTKWREHSGIDLGES